MRRLLSSMRDIRFTVNENVYTVTGNNGIVLTITINEAGIFGVCIMDLNGRRYSKPMSDILDAEAILNAFRTLDSGWSPF